MSLLLFLDLIQEECINPGLIKQYGWGSVIGMYILTKGIIHAVHQSNQYNPVDHGVIEPLLQAIEDVLRTNEAVTRMTMGKWVSISVFC